MAEFKKMYLISEVDYKLLKKTKGETEKEALTPTQDVDVQNNLDLNKKLTEISRTTGEPTKQSSRPLSPSPDMQIDESLIQDSLNDSELSLPEGAGEELMEEEVGQGEVVAEQFLYDRLRGYLPPKDIERGVILAKRIFFFDDAFINWNKQIITLGETEYSVMEFMDFIQLATSRKKPTQTDQLREFCNYLSQNKVPPTLLTNSYMRTVLIASNIAQKIEKSPAREASKVVFTPEKMSKFKWLNTIKDVDFDDE